MIMANPPHVGEILRELFLSELGVSVTEAAEKLGVSRPALSRLIHEKTGISAEMAIRLGKAFNNSPEFWMNMQKQYDLWEAVKKYGDLNIEPFDEAA